MFLSRSEAAKAWKADRARYGRGGWLQVSLWAIAVFRFGQWVDETQSGRVKVVLERFYWIAYLGAQIASGVSMTKATTVGRGLRIHHAGPVVVHGSAVLGAECTLEHGVTVGVRAHGGGVPHIGDRVFLGAFAQVLGPVQIGNDAKVGALSVVLTDVPERATAVGSPARIQPPRA